MLKIETENLIIRNHIESDWEDLYDYLKLEEMYKFEPGAPISKEDAKNMIVERSNGNNFFAVVLKDTGKMIGHLYFNHANPKHFLTWELGFIFNPEYQKKGYCSEASLAIIKYAFEELKAHKVTAFCNPKNIASWKVLEKVGMEREGHFKKRGFFRKDNNGNPIWHDCYAYGTLNSMET